MGILGYLETNLFRAQRLRLSAAWAPVPMLGVGEKAGCGGSREYAAAGDNPLSPTLAFKEFEKYNTDITPYIDG
jgi:hypothetical protein